ncbi:MAG: hypothetical protein RO257_00730 [Candidatus Kapabacteria bacterium]|nr:hypothetical protein [Candidatus Kapabacteria bacterium]
MRFVIYLFLTLFISNTLFAQTAMDTIVVDYAFWGNNYFIDGKEFSRGHIDFILEGYDFSKDLVKTSNNQKYWGYGTLSVGVLLTGVCLYNVWESYENYGEPPTKSSFYIKSALAIGLNFAAIIYFSKSKKSFSKAIKAYNKSLNADSGSNEFKINIDFNRITFTYSM